MRISPCPWRAGHFLPPLQVCSLVLVLVPALSAQDAPFRFSSGGAVRRMGVAKNVEVEFVTAEAGAIQQIITAVAGNQTSWVAQTGKDPIDGVLASFLPGDSGIRVKVNPEVGFTAVAGLKILDPAVLTIHQNGLVEADREGVRAVVWAGTISLSEIFVALPQSGGGFLLKEPLAPDGSLARPPGARVYCAVRMEGSEGASLVSREILSEGRRLFAFTSARPK